MPLQIPTVDAANKRVYVPLAEVVTLTKSTTLNAAEHANRVINMALAATLTFTLPAATGTGDVYTIYVSITATGDHVIQVTTTDVIQGGVTIAGDIAGVVINTAVTTDTLTLNGTTKGGIIGSWVRFTDVASAQWMLEGFLVSNTSEASPFSALVS